MSPTAVTQPYGRWGALSVWNFRVYFVGAMFALTGGWVLRTAQAWLVLELTDSPAALGFATAVQFLPITVLTLFAGVVIDRIQTRGLMVLVQVVIAAQSLVTAVLVYTHQAQFWQVVVLAAIQGIASAFDFPTRAAVVSELVEPRLVGNGIALNSSLNSMARIVGPAIGGLMIALWGTGICFVVTAIGSVGTAAALLALRRSQFYPKRQAGRGNVLGQLWSGLRYSFSTPSLGFNMVVSFFIGTFAYNWGLVLPLLARFALDSGSEGFGYLNTAMGVGSTVGGLVLAARVMPSLRLVLGGAATFAVMVVLVGISPNMPAAITAMLLVGLTSVVFSACTNTLLQTEAREDYRGRVLALYTVLITGTTPLGSAITGTVAQRFDVRMAMVLNGCVALLGVGLAFVYLRLARRRVTRRESAAASTA